MPFLSIVTRNRIAVVLSAAFFGACMLAAIVNSSACRDRTDNGLSAPPVFAAQSDQRSDSRPGALRIADDPIRSFVASAVAPQYPESAIRANQQGVVVAHVRLDEERHLAALEILEAPSPGIGDAVATAVRRWRFRRAEDDPAHLQNLRGRVLTGKLTFYFFQSGGQYKVAGPAHAPNMKALEMQAHAEARAPGGKAAVNR